MEPPIAYQVHAEATNNPGLINFGCSHSYILLSLNFNTQSTLINTVHGYYYYNCIFHYCHTFDCRTHL